MFRYLPYSFTFPLISLGGSTITLTWYDNIHTHMVRVVICCCCVVCCCINSIIGCCCCCCWWWWWWWWWWRCWSCFAVAVFPLEPHSYKRQGVRVTRRTWSPIFERPGGPIICCCCCSHINSLTKESVVTRRCCSPRKIRNTIKNENSAASKKYYWYKKIWFTRFSFNGSTTLPT